MKCKYKWRKKKQKENDDIGFFLCNNIEKIKKWINGNADKYIRGLS